MTLRRIQIGPVNAYLIPAQSGYILVDTGYSGLTFLLLRALAGYGVDPRQIRLIILTHTHFDHIGGLWIVQAQSGAAVMVHQAEAEILATGQVIIPDGMYRLTKPLARFGQWAGRFFRFPGYQAEHVITGEGMSLREFGLDGCLLHTPGHSPGSMTLLLANGDAIVGDLCPLTPINRLLGTRFPLYADNEAAVYHSWARLLDTPARILYPGHGPAYPVEELQRDRMLR